jgi:uncharacterized protein
MNTKKPAVATCPQCGKDVVWNNESPFRPFCSERCKLIDLGQWATESYSIPVETNLSDDLPTEE